MTKLISAVTAFIILYTIGWFVLAARVEKAIDEQLDAQKAHGTEITFSAEGKTGFPFSLQIKLQDFALKTQAGIAASAPVFVMGAGLSDWQHVTIAANNGLLLTLPAGKTRGEIVAAVSSANGAIDFGDAGISAETVTMDAVTISGLTPGDTPLSISTLALHIDRPDVAPTTHTQPGGHATINAGGIILPGAQIPALGNNIRQLSLDATVMGKLSSLDESALRAWSNDGGTVEIQTLSAAWGPLGIAMNGTLALDGQLQPIASFVAKISGYTDTLNALAATNVVKPSSAALASVGLGLLARPEGADNTPTVSVPLTLQNGVVYLSSFKLTRLPPVQVY